MASSHPEKLLGVRDGFVEFFRPRLPGQVPIILVPQEETSSDSPLALSDQETAAAARNRAKALFETLGREYLFYISSEGGLDTLEFEERPVYFARYWTAIAGPVGETLGASASLQLPQQLIEGLDSDDLPIAVPGSRRSGGMLGSLTGGQDSLRGAVSTATFNALTTLFFGILEGGSFARHPFRSRRP